MPIELLKRIGGGARSAGVNPGRVRLGDEHSKSDAVGSAETVQRMAAMRHIAQDDLTPLPRFIGLNRPCLSQCGTSTSTESGVVGSDTCWLNPQREARKSRVVDLEWFFFGLDFFAGEERRSYERLHDGFLPHKRQTSIRCMGCAYKRASNVVLTRRCRFDPMHWVRLKAESAADGFCRSGDRRRQIRLLPSEGRGVRSATDPTRRSHSCGLAFP